MRGSFLRSWAGVSMLVLVTPGCGYDPFGPPSRAKPAPRDVGAEVSKPKYLVFVVPGVPVGDLEVWAMRAQHEANGKRAIFRIMGPSQGDTPAKQAEMVRRAVADGASALLVCPGDSPELPKALAEAEAKGVAVVLIDKGVPAPEGSKPFTVVDYGPFDETAGQIVAATIDDLKKASRPVDGTAIVLANKVGDGTSARRVAALQKAAGAARFRKVVTVEFDGTVQDSAKRAALEAVKANPDLSVILTDDGEGMVGAATARSDSKGNPIFFVGGYTEYRTDLVVMPPDRESCYVQGRYDELGSLAVTTALAKLRGEAVGEHVFQPPKFVKTEAAISSEATPNSSFPELKPTNGRDEPTKDAKP